MKCQKCQKDLSNSEYKTVAEWTFCMECFEELLENPHSTKAEKAEESASTQKSTESIHCQLCGKTLPLDTKRTLGIWVFCESCQSELTPPPPEIKRKKVDNQVELEPDDRPRDLLGRPISQAKEEIVCTGCQRVIFSLAAKHVEDRAFCPECYRKLKQTENQPVKMGVSQKNTAFTAINLLQPKMQNENPIERAAPAMSVSVSVGQATSRSCDSCQRSMPETLLEHVGGFEICHACLEADRELAQKLARKNHLDKMKKRLE